MNIIAFVKSLFAKRSEHIESVKQIDKQIEEALYKVEPVQEKPKKKAKKKPAKKKNNGSKQTKGTHS